MTLIVAADLTSLADAAHCLGAAVGGAPSGVVPEFGHPVADAALADFHSSMRRHEAVLAAHAARGAASMRGYLHAFETAGG